MTLWDWAGATWARPGVSAAMLELQDVQGQCAPLLLWGLWLAEMGRSPVKSAVQGAVALCRDAQSGIEPLRSARRNGDPADRDRLLAAELLAERNLLDRLEEASSLPVHEHGDAANVLVELSTRWGRPLTPSAFRSLLEAVANVESADVG